MTLYKNDYALPELPIPRPEQTWEMLSARIKPLVSQKDWEEFDKSVIDFDGQNMQRLQQLLLDWKSDMINNSSWLRPIWDDVYLAYRGRLPINMNYTFELEGACGGGAETPAELICGLAHILKELAVEALHPEKTRGGFLSMDTLSYMMYTRIPGKIRDIWYRISLSEPLTAAVVCRGHWFILPLTRKDGETASLREISIGLESVRRQSEALPEAVGTGVITAAERQAAWQLRESLLDESLLNRVSLEQIEKAAFVVALDEEGAASSSFVRRLVAGDASNRWYDKSLQIICSGDKVGVNIEHSGCDAGIWVYLLSQVEAYLQKGLPGTEQGEVVPRLLKWSVSEQLKEKLRQERQGFTEFAGQMALQEERLENVSKVRIKQAGCRPDAFVQMLFQAIYHRLTGCFRSVYEAVSTRGFYQGRTECVRPCTCESVDFVTCFADKTQKKETLLEKFRKAEEAHSNQISICQKGLGPERHISGLLAMYDMYKDMDSTLTKPLFAQTPAFRILKHDAVSTSSTTAPFIAYFGFGPVVEDGAGIGYGLKENALHIAISAYKKSGINPKDFLNLMQENAEEFYKIFN